MLAGRQASGWAGRQASRQVGGQASGRAGRQVDGQVGEQAGGASRQVGRAGWWAERYLCWYAGRWAGYLGTQVIGHAGRWATVLPQLTMVVTTSCKYYMIKGSTNEHTATGV